MATNFPVVDEGSLYAGILTSGQIPERFLVGDMDNLTLNALITRGETAFMSMLHTRVPKSKIIKESRRHNIVEIEEFDRVILVTGASTGANGHTTFSVNNYQAPLLEPNDILFNRTNSYELVGKSARYTGPAEYATFASYLIRIRLISALLDPGFIILAMNAPYFRATQIEPAIVQQCGQANFNG